MSNPHLPSDVAPAVATDGQVVELIIEWYSAHARDLPWRCSDPDPWAVLASEVMLQQTPVARVLPVWQTWMRRWPTPTDLAGASPADVLRVWDRLGYPRRALRLWEAAQRIRDEHNGAVPETYGELRALPGVGDYTAAAVASFAYRQRHVVLDTNVRRVLARLVGGIDRPVAAGPTQLERRLAEQLLPPDPARAAIWSVAVMELGALICTARVANCATCPVRAQCRWLAQGKPASPVQARSQRYEGTDRQARGRILRVLRASPDPVSREQLLAGLPDSNQANRALGGLLADGLVDARPDDCFGLPT